MSSSFFEISKVIANNFLQNIVFVDDEAYAKEDDKEHDFDPLEMTKAFAKSQKICSIYNPLKEAELEDLIKVSIKADIVVIDWKIELEKHNDLFVNEEEDEEDELKGKYSLQIIKGILSKDSMGLKLIVIYTGETHLWQITEDIYKAVVADSLDFQKGDFEIKNNNIKICIIGKTSILATHTPEIRARIKSYEELPDFILNEYTSMTSGLLSNVALKSISNIRANTSRLLSTFNQQLDPAFLAHKSLLPDPEDASDQILDLIGSDIKSLIKSHDTASSISTDSINEFIDANIDDNVTVIIDQKDKFKEVNIPDTISRDDLKTVVKANIEKFFIKKTDPQEEAILFSKNCHKSLIYWFVTDKNLGEKININYAKLTTLKSFYDSNYIPILFPGTLLTTDDAKSECWLCIQPKCDSVRINTKRRDFLLLRLIKSTPDRFDIVIDENTFLRVDYSIYNSKLVGFKTSLNGSVSAVVGVDGKKRFERQDNLKMIWIGELKNDYAQSIINKFASDIARVGMDHSEWLRRSS